MLHPAGKSDGRGHGAGPRSGGTGRGAATGRGGEERGYLLWVERSWERMDSMRRVVRG